MQRSHALPCFWKKVLRAGTLAAVLSAVALPHAANAQQPIRVVLNGRPLNFPGAAPDQINGAVMVPMRAVFEALNATVDFKPETSTVYANRGTTQIQLTLNSTQAFVNGQPRPLAVPAQARLGRTLVPLRFVSEALGADVGWNGTTRTVTITDTSGTDTGSDTGGNTFPNDNTGTPGTGTPGTGTPGTGIGNPGTGTPGTGIPGTGVDTTPPYTTPGTAPSVSGVVLKVDPTLPATITLNTNNRVQTYNMTEDALVYRQVTGAIAPGTTPVYGAPTPVALGSIVPGEEVRLVLDAQNNVRQVVSNVSLIPSRVRFAGGNQIVLDDARGTTLTLGTGPNAVRMVDARGRVVNTATLQPGQNVALFVAPGTRNVYQISALSTDIAAANGGVNPGGTIGGNPGNPGNPGDTFPGDTFPGDNGNNGGTGNQLPAGTPRIQLVQHDARKALGNNSTLVVTVRGTPGARGTFDVSPRAQGLELLESNNQPGLYTGTYTIRPGDDVLNGRVTAHLMGNNGQEDIDQSQAPITIDTVAPRILETTPGDRETINTARPNVSISVDDLGGSGIARATVTFSNNGQNVKSRVTVNPPFTVTAVPTRDLSGQVTATITVADAAGNAARSTLTFFVQGDEGVIRSVTHNATRPLQAGDVLSVTLEATPGGQASFDVLDETNHMVQRNVRMNAVDPARYPGRYRGNYTIPDDLNADSLRIVGRFNDLNNQISTMDATTTVRLDVNNNGTRNGNNINGNDALTITDPDDTDRVTSPLVIRGRATPNALVEVSVRATGVRYLFLEYQQDLGTQQLQADANGNWQTQPITLPKPRNVTGLKYTVTATQTDAANRRSEPVEITLTPQ